MKRTRIAWLGGVVALLLAAAPLAADVPEALLRNRYHAILSAGEALTVSGEIRREHQELIVALTAAWNAGDRERLLPLLERAELRFGAAGVPLGAALRIVVGPDGAILDGPVDGGVLRALLLEIRRDVWIEAPFLTDELALYHRLQRESAPAVIVVAFPPPAPNPEGFVPPRGWAERAMLIERWRRLAAMARPGESPPIILDGSLEPGQPDLHHWMLAERLARPRGPFLLRQVDPATAPLGEARPGDHWILDLGSERLSAFETLRLVMRLDLSRLDLIAPPDHPWFDVLAGFFRKAEGSLRTFGFGTRRISGLQAGREMLFLNQEERPVRVEIVAVPGPIGGRLALLGEPGSRPEIQRVTAADALRFDLPPGIIALVRIEGDD